MTVFWSKESLVDDQFRACERNGGLSVPQHASLRDRDVCGGAKMGQRHSDDALVSSQHAIVPIAVFGNIHLFHIAVTSVVECLSLKVVQIEFRRRPSYTTEARSQE